MLSFFTAAIPVLVVVIYIAREIHSQELDRNLLCSIIFVACSAGAAIGSYYRSYNQEIEGQTLLNDILCFLFTKLCWLIPFCLHAPCLRKMDLEAGSHHSDTKGFKASQLLHMLGLMLCIDAISTPFVLAPFFDRLSFFANDEFPYFAGLGILSSLFESTVLLSATSNVSVPSNPRLLNTFLVAGESILLIGSTTGPAMISMGWISVQKYLQRMTQIVLVAYLLSTMTFAAVYSVLANFGLTSSMTSTIEPASMPLADSISCQVIGCLAVILDQQITVGQDSEAVPRRADGIRNVDRELQFAITNTSFVNLLKLLFRLDSNASRLVIAEVP